MKRLNCRELHEYAFFPSVLRDGLTDFLGFFAAYSGIYRGVEERVADLIRQSGENIVVEDCAGSGFFGFHLARRLPPVSYRLADLYPNRNWRTLVERSGGMLQAEDGPLPLRESIIHRPGIHLVLSALHHFSEEELTELLRLSAEQKRILVFADYSERKVIREILAAPFGLLFVLLTAPLVFPFSWKRLFFTYIVPAIPVLVLVDGLISRLRSYRLDELKNMISRINLPHNCQISCGIDKKWYSISVCWMIVTPFETGSVRREYK